MDYPAIEQRQKTGQELPYTCLVLGTTSLPALLPNGMRSHSVNLLNCYPDGRFRGLCSIAPATGRGVTPGVELIPGAGLIPAAELVSSAGWYQLCGDTKGGVPPGVKRGRNEGTVESTF